MRRAFRLLRLLLGGTARLLRRAPAARPARGIEQAAALSDALVVGHHFLALNRLGIMGDSQRMALKIMHNKQIVREHGGQLS